MNQKTAIGLISEVFRLNEEIGKFGGAENAPTLWQEFINARIQLFQEFNMPDTMFYRKLLDAAFVFKARNANQSDLYGFTCIREQLESIGYSCSDEFSNNDIHNEIHTNRVFNILCFEASVAKVTHGDWNRFLEYARWNRMPISDVLNHLKFDDLPYNRFLIGEIYYGGYGTPIQVWRELQRTKEPDIEIKFIFYGSGRIEDRQVATEWLRYSDLAFIDQFLWMDQFELECFRKISD